METVYIDSLFALNLVIDYLLLLCAGRVAGAALRRGRFFLAALLGAGYAVCAVLPGAGFLAPAPMKLALGLLMGLVAFGGEARLGRCVCVFLAVSAAFGGAVWGASMLAGGAGPAGAVVPVSLRVLALSFAVCYAGLTLFFRRAGTRPEQPRAALALAFRGRRVTLNALVDTGNALADPATGRRVAVAEARALRPLFPDGGAALAAEDPAELFRRLAALPGCLGRVSLVPYSALGTRHGLLAAFRPDEALVDGEARPLLVAISPAPLSDDGCTALL